MSRTTLALMAFLAAAVPASTAAALQGLALRNNTGWFQTGDVVLVDVGTGKATTVVSGGGCFGYCFSPDGTKIAFWRAGKIYTVKLDGTGLTPICSTDSQSYTEQLLSWTADDHIYWSEGTPYIHRVEVSTGITQVAHTSPGGKIQLAKVSLDGRHAGFERETSGSWKAWAVDLDTHQERTLGTGCQCTSSPDGTLLTHNLPGHQDANIQLFSDLSIVQVVHKPAGRTEFDQHEFSHSSNNHIVYTCDTSHAYVHELSSDTATYIGSGAPFDFRPAPAVGTPTAKIQPTVLAFNAIVNGAAPAEEQVNVSNAGGGTLDTVQVTENAAWLSVNVTGTGNAQVLHNVVDHSGLAAGTYSTTVSVNCANAVPTTVSYQVTLVVKPKPTGVNQPPQVAAGIDVEVPLGMNAYLTGTATDDGLPSGQLTTVWSKVSGPGAVVFSDAKELSTRASFDVAGVHVLRLTADDGALQASDELTVTVTDRPAPKITILSPAGGESWIVGATVSIRWDAVGLDDVAIRYSTDGGESFSLITDSLDRSDPGWGDLSWQVPDAPSSNCVILISGYANESPTRSGTFEIRAPDGESSASGCGCSLHGPSLPGQRGAAALLLCLVVILRRRRRRSPESRRRGA